MKILVATDKPFAPVAVTGIREVVEKAGHALALLEKYKTPEELHAAVADADAMIVRSDIVDAAVIAAAPKLKIVVRAGAGYDNLDLNACTEGNVVAMNTPGQNSNAVAELAFGMMVYAARGGFDGKSGSELMDKTLGIHAFGNVGRCMARIAAGFGMKTYAFDPFVDNKVIAEAGVTPVDTIEELYSKCQYVSLHIPANEKTKGSIGERLLSLMPQGAVLVNTARKEVINETELVALMEKRGDLKYLSDIAPDNTETFATKFAGRYFFTPKKMGAQTEEANINAGVAAARQIVSFLATGDETFRVNKPR
ncbi:MAG: NAD(P)-dependent oxidoreductase [Bacteroidales bacterium]|jgi:D-3-phosphoglycerate dehydrogenase|nr:NAD(P)-dependent oxidoreductase [Bacteroidales bacterium]